MEDKIIYVIVILCNDDGEHYIDYVNKKFYSKSDALKEMTLCANNEMQSLEDVGNYEYVRLNEEISIYDENKELITRYSLVRV